jgi:hypothetical protein
VPSTALQFDAPLGGWPQTPSVAPLLTVQMPPQQSAPVVQTSPFCSQ